MGRALRSMLLLGGFAVACSTSPEPAQSPAEIVAEPPPETPAPPVSVKQARCNPKHAFAAPVKVPGLETVDGSARFSDDELFVVFSNRVGNGLVDLFEASRTSIAEPFGAPKPVGGSAGVGARMFPTIAKDDRTLFFAFMHVLDDGPHVDIFSASRTDAAAAFAPAEALAPLNVFRENTTPFAAKHAPEVWFAAGPSASAYAIFRSKLDTSTTPPTPGRALQVIELDTTYAEAAPILSDDGLVIYFSSNRPEGGAKGDHDIWYAMRTDVASRFGNPRNVDVVNTTELEYPTWLSPDMCRLYIVRGAGPTELFVASRQPH